VTGGSRPRMTRKEAKHTAGWRLWAAWVGARIVAWASRLLGRGGSSLPGRVALWLAPDVVAAVARQTVGGVVLVTGTNGKTTTAGLVAGMLRTAGRRVAHNRSGANLLPGIAFALLEAYRPGVLPDMAVLETDEATVPRAAPLVRPRVVLVTNFFRDQLDRYGELSTTVRFVGTGLEYLGPGGRAVLNADDPHVAQLGAGVEAVYYGLEGPVESGGPLEDPGDARFCPRCGTELVYTVRRYAHLGLWRCPGCGARRPTPQVALVGFEEMGRWLRIRTPAGEWRLPFGLPGVYNLYNAVAAVATGWVLGLDAQTIRDGLASRAVAFGRMEGIRFRGREVRMALVKNPTGFNQVLAAVASDPRPKTLVVAINDLDADGRDVSWLWDVDLETLWPRARAKRWWVTGLRARDMAVRLKYAGCPPERITVRDGSPERGVLAALDDDGADPVYVLPTYTALLAVRRVFEREGAVRPFREG
jgi:UDP-N-acetylmuramyl tripeptide synthase